MEYIPTGKKPDFKYRVGDFVCYKKYGDEFYGEIKLQYYYCGNALYGVSSYKPVLEKVDNIKLEKIDYFFYDQKSLDAVYEEDIF